MNVGSGGGAAAAPTAGGAGAGGAEAVEEKKEEEKEEGKIYAVFSERFSNRSTDAFYSKGRIRRGYGLRSLRLETFCIFPVCTFKCMATVFSVQHWLVE